MDFGANTFESTGFICTHVRDVCIHFDHVLYAPTPFLFGIGEHRHSVDWRVHHLSSLALGDTRWAVLLDAGLPPGTYGGPGHERRASARRWLDWKRESKINPVFILRILTMLWEFCFRDLRRWIRQEWVTQLAMVNHGLLYLQSTLIIFYFGYLNISDYMKFFF